jgi:hypothetical protein
MKQIFIFKFHFTYLIDIVIESLDNYRSSGSAFPLRNSNLFKYLPPSDHSVLSPIMSNHIPTFIPINNRRIDLTPGVLVPFRRYRRLSSPRTSHNRVLGKVKSIQKKSPPPSIKKHRQFIVHKVKKKFSRGHLSHQLTELIRMNNKPSTLNTQDSIINSTRKWTLPTIDINQSMPISTNYVSM